MSATGEFQRHRRVDVPEVTLTGKINAYGDLNLLLSRPTSAGALRPTIGANLNDPNKDGKVRVGELIRGFPHCLFDFQGGARRKTEAYLRWALAVRMDVEVHHRRGRTAKFPVDVQRDFGRSPMLATPLGDGTLRLNMGPNAWHQYYANPEDVHLPPNGPPFHVYVDTMDNTDETFHVSRKKDEEGNNVEGTVVVTLKGWRQEYTGVSHIVADGGRGNDRILDRSRPAVDRAIPRAGEATG